ncbi:cytochrome C biogenesis protein [Neisseria zalophi]|uniref:Cytochrome C biogenesis protein n=1 Tax=Neisseria zalophi TaxID=640030 RepID=A0A5J6PVC9_9NEIS|nr:cytochrome C biogenesis protein [Neisseria zalophi]QEY26194.1 cytochrome C biogenesis protein [Neisseria zalophi]
MLKKTNQFIQNNWLSILIWCLLLSIFFAYYSTNLIFKLLGAPIISLCLVLLFHLELERKQIRFLSIIQVFIGILFGLALQIKRENFMVIEGVVFGGIIGLLTPLWVKLFLLLKEKIKDYI